MDYNDIFEPNQNLNSENIIVSQAVVYEHGEHPVEQGDHICAS
jgi:hypothetical protein